MHKFQELTDLEQIVEEPTDTDVLNTLDLAQDAIEQGYDTQWSSDSSQPDIIPSPDWQESINLLDTLRQQVVDYLSGITDDSRQAILEDFFTQIEEAIAARYPGQGSLDEVTLISGMAKVQAAQNCYAVSQQQLDSIDRTTRSLSDVVGGLGFSEAMAIQVALKMLNNWVDGQRESLAKDIAYELNKGNLPAGQGVIPWR